MDKKKIAKLSKYVLLAGMTILTVLFFGGIKFMIAGLNIIVWDGLVLGGWIFVKLCQWAGRENTTKRTLAVIAVTFVGLLASAMMVFGLAMRGGWLCYIEQTEPQTGRTFVVEYQDNLFNKGSAKLYERFGPFILSCDEEEYIGEFTHVRPEERQIYLSGDGKNIVVAFFFLEPVFVVPVE